MIAGHVVAEVRRLLEEGRLSQRKIAQWTGVSRGTVNAIARGQRADPEARRCRGADMVVPPSGPPRRCPGCGGMVQMPCLLCQLRVIRRAGHSAQV
jgi:DNA-binding XRE family transcriptional regulator